MVSAHTVMPATTRPRPRPTACRRQAGAEGWSREPRSEALASNKNRGAIMHLRYLTHK